MDHGDVDQEQQVSMTIDNYYYSDSESSSSSSTSSPFLSKETSQRFNFFNNLGLIKVEDGNMEHRVVKKAFFASIGPFGHHTNLVAIHKNVHSNLIGQARFEAFRTYSEAVATKCGGDANLRFAWYGASRHEISKIISHGFCCKKPDNGLCYGVGIHLSPLNISVNSVLSAMEDERGLRHVLLCRVVLGNMEVVQAGSDQFQPSSNQFDSGVDDPLAPKTYIVWSAYVNSHILPKYIISFKVASSTGSGNEFQNCPRSPFMRIPCLLSVLSYYLHPSKIDLLSKYHRDFLAKKITRDELIQRLRQIAGDKLLRYVINLCKNMKY